MCRFLFASLLVTLATVNGGITQAAAQAWPSRPVTLMVPFTSGTTSDVVARSLVDPLSKAIGQTVIIDNRGGAGGNIGAGVVARPSPTDIRYCWQPPGRPLPTSLCTRT